MYAGQGRGAQAQIESLARYQLVHRLPVAWMSFVAANDDEQLAGGAELGELKCPTARSKISKSPSHTPTSQPHTSRPSLHPKPPYHHHAPLTPPDSPGPHPLHLGPLLGPAWAIHFFLLSNLHPAAQGRGPARVRRGAQVPPGRQGGQACSAGEDAGRVGSGGCGQVVG